MYSILLEAAPSGFRLMITIDEIVIVIDIP
jgi:hypothetical protein